MDKHTQQTNDRLHCIKQQLCDIGGFQSAARELLEWCSDPRAFQLQFEDSLMGCLTVVYKVACHPGYDLDLGYRLLAVCSSHKDRFSQKASGQLSEWNEELGRYLLLRHTKNRPAEGSKDSPHSVVNNMHPQIHKTMPHMHPGGDPNSGWGPPGQGQTQLNVVTTIFPVHTTQSGPFTHSTPGFANTTMTGASGHGQPPPGPYPSMTKSGYSSQVMSPYNGYSLPPNASGPNQPPMPGAAPNDYTAPPGALSAAAYVAAAATATATATATASMVAIQEQQNHHHHQHMMHMNSQYGPGLQMSTGHHQYSGPYPPNMPGQRHPMPMGGSSCPTMGPMKSSMYHRRPAPYQNPYAQKQQTIYPNGSQMDPYVPSNIGPHGPTYMGPHQPYPGKPGYPQSPGSLPSPTYGMPPNMAGMRPIGPTPYPNGQHPYMTQGQYGAPQRQVTPAPSYSPYPGQTHGSFPHSPIPGNPTPPITPGAVQGYPGDMKPAYPPDIKPMVKTYPDEQRLTFTVRDGVVLPPFRLEHNLAVSNHVFQLRDTVYERLINRSDLELQLKCFHHEDRQMNTNWPASVTVSVNATPLNIERGDNKTTHKPLYLKDVCQVGRNTIQITVTACCCSHLFVLQLVHRPSIRSVLQGLLRKRLLPAEHCITKIKRNFSSASFNSSSTVSSNNGDDGVEQTAIKISLKCPITYRRIMLPARGNECKHIQCFDLQSYLQLNCEKGSWKCPVCSKSAPLELLEIDQYIWGILTNMTNLQFEEVTINQTASWKPVPPIKCVVKEEDTGDLESCQNNWMKAMSPSSMQLPTMTSWDGAPVASPYSLPHPPTPGDPLGQGLRHMDPSRPPSNNHMTPRPSSQPHPQQNGSSSLSNLSHPSPNSSSSSSSNNMVLSSNTPTTTNCSNNSNISGAPAIATISNNNNSNISGAPAIATISNGITSSLPTDCPSLDFNFDPSAIINGDSSAADGLSLFADSFSDIELLTAYLGPSDATGDNGQNSSSTGDDLLALFEN